MTKADAIYDVMMHNDGAIFITSCGLTSKFAYEVAYYEDKTILPLTGSMGMTASLSIGYALARPEKRVVAIMGDGDFLMGFNALFHLMEDYEYLDNLIHIVLIDKKYQSTGGQPLVNGWNFPIIEMVRNSYTNIQDVVGDETIDWVFCSSKGSSIIFMYVDNDDKKAPRVPDDQLATLARGLKC